MLILFKGKNMPTYVELMAQIDALVDTEVRLIGEGP